LKGEKATFVNLAAIAGPVGGKLESMMDVNYKAPVAAAKACQQLGFGHWVQSSTQATNSERAGQVILAFILLNIITSCIFIALVTSNIVPLWLCMRGFQFISTYRFPFQQRCHMRVRRR